MTDSLPWQLIAGFSCWSVDGGTQKKTVVDWQLRSIASCTSRLVGFGGGAHIYYIPWSHLGVLAVILTDLCACAWSGCRCNVLFWHPCQIDRVHL